ncbi:MAG: YezD family protein [Methylococcaceae bacterium]
MALKLEKPQREPRTAEIANQIADILQEIKFGSIEITVHESKVVQIERKEKLRFDSKK